MRRLTGRRRDRSSSSVNRADLNGTSSSSSMSCIPASLLCSGLPPVSPPAVNDHPVAVSGNRTSSRAKVKNNDNRRTSRDGGLERHRTNDGVVIGVALLGGGSGQHRYARFIDTLRREQSLVKGGVFPTADVEKQRHSKSRPLSRRLRKRPTTVEAVDVPDANGHRPDEDSSETAKKSDDIRLPAPESATTKFSSAADNSAWKNADDTRPISRRRPRTSPDPVSSPSDAGSVESGAPLILETMESSPRQRRRWRREERRNVDNGGRSDPHMARPRHDDALTANDEDRLDGLHSFNLSRRTAKDTEPKLNEHASTVVEHRHTGDDVGLFGLTVDLSTIPFVDSDYSSESMTEVSDESSLPHHLTTSDRDLNVQSVLETSCRSWLAGSLLVGRLGSQWDVCRRRTSWDYLTAGTRPFRLSQSQPSLSRSGLNHVSSAVSSGTSVNRLTRIWSHRSELLNTCVCSISWWPATTSVACVVKSTYTDVNDDECNLNCVVQDVEPRSPSHTHPNQPMPQGVFSAIISPKLQLQISNPRQKHVTLFTNDTVQLTLRGSSNEKRNFLSEEIGGRQRRHVVRVFWVVGRRRRRGSTVARRSVRVELRLTRLLTKDHQTKFVRPKIEATVATIESCHTDYNSDGLSVDVSSDSGVRSFNASWGGDFLVSIIDDRRNGISRNLALPCKTSKPRTTAIAVDCTICPGIGFSTVESVRQCSISVSETVADVASLLDYVISGEVFDVSDTVVVYQFAEVTSIFNNFAEDLLPTTVDAMTLVPYGAGVDKGGGSRQTRALVRRPGAGVTYGGDVVPYGSQWKLLVPLPLMTWTWDNDELTGSHLYSNISADVDHLSYTCECRAVNVNVPVDSFSLIMLSTS